MNKPIVAMPFSHHATHVCEEARKILLDAGFELRANDTGRKLTEEEQHEMIKDAYAVISGTEKYDRKMLDGCDNLRVIMRFGVGVDNYDLEAMKEKGIQVGVIANYNAVAEFALMLILNAMKNYSALDKAVRQGKWDRYPMRELMGKTVGIIGFGRIGKRLAELLQPFNVDLLIYDPFVKEETVSAFGAKLASIDGLLKNSDVVSLHLPSTKDTYHIICEETIAKMKDGAYLINTSRGALVDESAVVKALQSGKLSGFGSDVYETEPVKSNNPLFDIANTQLTPHTAAITFETNYNGGFICARSILNVRNGEKPVYPIV